MIKSIELDVKVIGDSISETQKFYSDLKDLVDNFNLSFLHMSMNAYKTLQDNTVEDKQYWEAK